LTAPPDGVQRHSWWTFFLFGEMNLAVSRENNHSMNTSAAASRRLFADRAVQMRFDQPMRFRTCAVIGLTVATSNTRRSVLASTEIRLAISELRERNVLKTNGWNLLLKLFSECLDKVGGLHRVPYELAILFPGTEQS
jgi:hypothetical protein